MKLSEQLHNIIVLDKTIIFKEINIISNDKDIMHVERKKQQRAITNDMILIALFYGKKSRSFQDTSYTVLDRSLFFSAYEKYIDKLRGLTIIGNWCEGEFYIITCYWNFLVKSRKRY